MGLASGTATAPLPYGSLAVQTWIAVGDLRPWFVERAGVLAFQLRPAGAPAAAEAGAQLDADDLEIRVQYTAPRRARSWGRTPGRSRPLRFAATQQTVAMTTPLWGLRWVEVLV